MNAFLLAVRSILKKLGCSCLSTAVYNTTFSAMNICHLWSTTPSSAPARSLAIVAASVYLHGWMYDSQVSKTILKDASCSQCENVYLPTNNVQQISFKNVKVVFVLEQMIELLLDRH